MTPNKRAIIKVSISGSKGALSINHSRRIYSILRRYTPEVAEGSSNTCYAELTGLRTFFKMSYAEMMTVIKKEVEKELDHAVTVGVATISEFESGKRSTKRSKVAKSVSTYTEMNELFRGARFVPKEERKEASFNANKIRTKKVKLSIPFLGKVS
jgi:hypothetical protein